MVEIGLMAAPRSIGPPVVAPPGGAAGPIAQVPEAAFAEVDLVVEVRSRAGGSLEPGSELHALDRVDAEDGHRQPPIELSVPVNVAAETRRYADRDHPKGSTQRVAPIAGRVDLRHH